MAMLLIQKFGGSSVATPLHVRRVAERVVRARRAGHRVVVVVSAMGATTDDLFALAGAVAADAARRHPRELDMLLTAGERIAMALLAMAIREAGEEAISFTGSQAAIITDGAHTGARIEEVRATRVREELDRGRVVIVAGFQGVSRAREVTTLGRGGSDTTAVALAAALGGERCDIYTDVDAVFTADPHRVPAARRIPRIAYREMLEMAQAGARVMHPRAVELAARYGIPVRVLSSFRDEDGASEAAAGGAGVVGGDFGTLIAGEESGMEQPAVTGLASERGYARILLHGLPAGMHPTAAVLSRLAAEGVSVDMVSPMDREDGRRQLQLSVREADLKDALAHCEALLDSLGGERAEPVRGLTRIALVGSGMHGRPGVYARAFETLVEAGVDVHGLSTSSVSITLLVEADDEEQALRALHTAFGLDADAAGADRASAAPVEGGETVGAPDSPAATEAEPAGPTEEGA
ncbi:MAG: aspartate kinase [Gemmatimonadota bacterium]